jgi:hypothetical protein
MCQPRGQLSGSHGGLSRQSLPVLLVNWPYTTFVIMPTNSRLMNTRPDAATAETRRVIADKVYSMRAEALLGSWQR